jgi:hypothetical protein
MAAIAIAKVSCEETNILLNTGQLLTGRLLFVEGYSVEDYVFYVRKLLRSRTLLLDDVIAVGEAPANLAAWLSLWARWTYDNVPVFLRFVVPAVVSGKVVGVTKSLALLYHGASWFSHPNIALLGLGTIWCAVEIDSVRADALGALLLSVLVLEIVRRFVPTPKTSVAGRLCRLFGEIALFPVSLLYVCAGMMKGYLNVVVPIATPRARAGERPAWWVGLSYGLFMAMAVFGTVVVITRINETRIVRALELAAVVFASWFVAGLSAVILGEIGLGSFASRARRWIWAILIS